MIRAYSGQVTTPNIGDSVLLNVGVPAGQTWIILEIRTPSDVVLESQIVGQLNGVIQYEIMPTFNNHDYVIGDTLVGPVDINFYLHKATAVAQTAGVVVVFERPA